MALGSIILVDKDLLDVVFPLLRALVSKGHFTYKCRHGVGFQDHPTHGQYLPEETIHKEWSVRPDNEW